LKSIDDVNNDHSNETARIQKRKDERGKIALANRTTQQNKQRQTLEKQKTRSENRASIQEHLTAYKSSSQTRLVYRLNRLDDRFLNDLSSRTSEQRRQALRKELRRTSGFGVEIKHGFRRNDGQTRLFGKSGDSGIARLKETVLFALIDIGNLQQRHSSIGIGNLQPRQLSGHVGLGAARVALFIVPAQAVGSAISLQTQKQKDGPHYNALIGLRLERRKDCALAQIFKGRLR
jgi:hypothetical protein